MILSFCSTEPTYDIDKGQLEARYKRLQKDLHPDKFGGRDAQQQEYSAEQSSLVNHAYVKLKSPLQRALYLVSTTAFTIMGIFYNLACMQNPLLSIYCIGQKHIMTRCLQLQSFGTAAPAHVLRLCRVCCSWREKASLHLKMAAPLATQYC